uniref:MAT1 centre domain-containing protein n=1 Tax=Eutreptiella gymnastica TaxID=73025 RepID=A0A7S4FQ02_9EUGL
MKRRAGPPNYFQREAGYRRQLAETYNKTREDFASLEEYNNYLEDLECIIYNLTYDIEYQSQLAKIEKYKRENKQSIYAKNSKKTAAQETNFIATTSNGTTASVVKRLPNPLKPEEGHRFMQIVRQGYYNPSNRGITQDEVVAGGLGYHAKRQRTEAYSLAAVNAP